MNGLVNAAAKEAHDEELEKMEAEIAAKVADPNYVEPVQEEASAEEKTAAGTSAETEEKQPSSEKTETTPPAQPDGGKPAGDHEELTDEEVQKLSEKAQKRFKSLADQNMRVKQENEFLRKHMKSAEKPEPSAPAPSKLPWETQEEEEGAEDPAVIARRETLAVIAEEKRQDAIITNLKSDSEHIEAQYEELNPQSEKYDPTLVTKISVWYKGLFKDNNDLRLKDFVTELMSLRATGIDQGRSEVTEKVVKQAAQQAIISNAPSSPATSSVEKQIAGAKTIAELDALEASL